MQPPVPNVRVRPQLCGSVFVDVCVPALALARQEEHRILHALLAKATIASVRTCTFFVRGNQESISPVLSSALSGMTR